jgi:protein transport protein SEC61 subunit alpha
LIETLPLTEPFIAFQYFAFIVIGCAIFSKTWIEVSGSAPRDVAKQLKDQGLLMAGHREQSYVVSFPRIQRGLLDCENSTKLTLRTGCTRN